MTADDFIVKEARKDVAAAHEQSDRPGEARALFELASILSGLKRSDEAKLVFDQLKPIGEELIGPAKQAVVDARNWDDQRMEAHALFALSKVLRYVGRHEEAAHIAEQASQCLNERIELDNHDRAERARQATARAIGAARERGDRRAEENALRRLGSELRRANRNEEATHAAEQASQISRELFELENRDRAERARQAAARAIGAARERGDRRAEASALLKLSSELRNAYHDVEAAHVTGQAMRISREQRVRERVESATQAVSTAQAQGDRAAEALALLTLGQALVALERPAEAEPVFEQAEQLTNDVIAVAKLAAADTRHRAGLLTGLSTLITLGKALRDAGRDDVARHVTEQASQLDPACVDAVVQTVEGNRSPAVTNYASDVEAGSVIQVGVVHGDLTVHSEARRSAAALQASVTTEQAISTRYYYDGGNWCPDWKVHVFVEAFTTQAVILRQLRPVVVRRIRQFGESNALTMLPREFRVGLDVPSTSYGAILDGQALDLDAAFAAGTADFPFYVTASDPEYFVIVPEPRRTKGLIEWRLELDWSCLGQHGTMTIDHAGRPFLSAR